MADAHRPERDESSSLASTRQLLDELDALMEKMLALQLPEAGGQAATQTELEEREETPETETDGKSTDRSESPQDDAPNYRFEELEAGEEMSEASAEESDDEPEADLAALKPAATTEEILQSFGPKPEDVLPEPLAERLAEIGKRQRRRQLWLWPLRVVNRGFDAFTYCLGPVGAWLRRPSGRLFLGLLGATLALAAALLQIVLWLAWS